MAKMFGLPGLDDASNRAFAAKLMKYAGWRSVTYRGNGVFDVDYHFAGPSHAGLPLPGASRQRSASFRSSPFVAARTARFW